MIRVFTIVTILCVFVACQDPSPPPIVTPDPPIACDGHRDTCVLQCCPMGYACQRGTCLDAAYDLDLDGYISAWDCDDYDRLTYPGAPELCNHQDNNCNGLEDDGVRDEDGTCHILCEDRDGDGSQTCDDPPDCDDDDPAVHPEVDGETPDDICDSKDNDCNGISDDGSDVDGDGVGACNDCDDANPAVATGFPEVCDGFDNDCDGAVDGDDDEEVCGRLGICTDAARCEWRFDSTNIDEVEQGEGYLGATGGWCAGPGQPVNYTLVNAPARGSRDLPSGIYVATFRVKVSDNTHSWSSCGTALRLRANDRDEDQTGTCTDCLFGGDVALVPRHFTSPGAFEEHQLNFSIGPERVGHVLEVVALRGSCRDIEVCIGDITIIQQ